VPADVEPPELAQLLDFAERPRVDDWSLRAALVRYAQPHPQRVEDLLQVVRRLDAALGALRPQFERDGARQWAALDGDGDGEGDMAVALLRAAREIDGLGDELAAWAVDISRPAPDDDVDRVTTDVAHRLDELGVPREERPPGPRNRG
jgi:hypothetical protein